MAPRRAPVAIVGAGAISAFGIAWRGLGRALLDGAVRFAPSRELEASHPGTAASEVSPIPAAEDAGDVRQRKQMARAARFACIAAKRALQSITPGEARASIGFYLGVGASGGAVSDLEAVLRASMDGDSVSLARLGDAGLSATNPVSTFQLLNNFTLCHAAILEGVGGPNGAFFSRGGGTVFAFMKAIAAIRDGDCDLALAGGADSALHAVTWAELVREGFAARSYIPGEGAGLLLLARDAPEPLAFVERASLHAIGEGAGALEGILRDAWADLGSPAPDLVVFAPWGDPPRIQIRSFLSSIAKDCTAIDISLGLGDALAASPAFAWLAALDLLTESSVAHRRALVLSAGIDGQLGVAVLSRPGIGGTL